MSIDKIHVIVDIETLDVVSSAVILSIGACTIDMLNAQAQLYIKLDPNTQFERTKSQSTIDWWAKQSVPMPVGTIQIQDALQTFKRWISSLRAEPIIWCKGTDFDTAILAHAYNQFKIELPWRYYNIRDYRTVQKLFPSYSFPPNPKAHDALADALHQAECLKGILKANPNLSLA